MWPDRTGRSFSRWHATVARTSSFYLADGSLSASYTASPAPRRRTVLSSRELCSFWRGKEGSTDRPKIWTFSDSAAQTYLTSRIEFVRSVQYRQTTELRLILEAFEVSASRR